MFQITVARLQTAAVFVVASSLLACGSGEKVTEPDNNNPPPPAVASIVVTAPRNSIITGDSITVTAVVRDSTGTVLTDRAISWSTSNTAVATVGADGVVRGVGRGSTVIAGASEGKTASVQLTVNDIVVDESRSVSLTFDTVGGTLSTTSSSGVSYTLQIPAGAIESPISISMAPVSGLRGAQFSGGLLGAVRLSPAGLTFQRGVTLRITGVSTPSAGRAAFAFVGPDSGGIDALLPSTLVGNVLTVVVPHFSVVGVGADVPERIASLTPRPDSLLSAIHLDYLALLLSTDAPRSDFNTSLANWGSSIEQNLHNAANSTVQAADAIADYSLWMSTIEFIADARPYLAPIATEDPLKSRILQNSFHLANGLFGAMARNNLACRTTKSFEDAEIVLYWQRQAEELGLADIDLSAGGIPSLSRSNVLALLREHCLAVVLDTAILVDTLEPGVPTDLTVDFKVQFVGHSTMENAAFGITIVPGNTTVSAPSGFSTAQGRYVTGLTADNPGPMQIIVQACLVFPGRTTASDICRSETVSRTVADQMLITTDALDNGQVGSSYSQTLAATGGVGSYTWSISAGALPPGLTLGASSGTITGTPSAAGSYTFTVRAASGTQSASKTFSITITDGTQSFSVDVRAESDLGICTQQAKTGALPLSVGAACIAGEHLPAGQAGATVQLTMEGTVTALTWTGSASTGPWQNGHLTTLVGGFGNVQHSVPGSGGTLVAQVNPGWATGAYSIGITLSYAGNSVTARFQRTSDNTIIRNETSAMLPLVGGGADSKFTITLFFTCASGQHETHTRCVGSGNMATVTITP